MEKSICQRVGGWSVDHRVHDAWPALWLRRAAERTDAEHRLLQQLLELCPDARLAFGLTERFLQLVRERQANLLDA